MPTERRSFQGWKAVSSVLHSPPDALPYPPAYLDKGQSAGLKALAGRLAHHGAVLADEVGMGKTRIAVALSLAVIRCGGRVAVAAPSVVGPQWQEELSAAGERSNDILSSFDALMKEYRKQLENPGAPIAGVPLSRMDVPIVMLSHRFGDIRASTPGVRWRATLLLQLAIAHGLVDRSGQPYVADVPNCVQAAANAIAVKASNCTIIRESIAEITHELSGLPTVAEIFDPASAAFERSSCELKLLERTVGLLLGPFDLLIIDEAHKSRSETSKLATLTDHILLPSGKSFRRLGMTATPVEIDVDQWRNTLRRVDIEDEEWKKIAPAVHTFREAAAKVRRTWRFDEESRIRYAAASADFQSRLSPWIVRRDKRRDDSIRQFNKHSTDGRSYRKNSPILVESVDLSVNWKRIVLAAEALSAIGQAAAGSKEAMARLTISNGHGIAGIVDRLARHRKGRDVPTDDAADRDQMVEDYVDAELEPVLRKAGEAVAGKRAARAEWWKNLLTAPFFDQNESLYDHPVVTAVVSEIEKSVCAGEKVLVFGRYTRPMRILTELLNARALLRAKDNQTPWPQQRSHDEDQKALAAAARQMDRSYDRGSLDSYMSEAYDAFEDRRQALRDQTLKLLDAETTEAVFGQAALLGAIGRDVERAKIVSYLARAVEPFISKVDGNDQISSAALSTAYGHVFDALHERADKNVSGHEQLSFEEALRLWPHLRERLVAEYSAPRATFARMLNGQTLPRTRRLVQLAFNRAESEPHVLVAQSMVGREGLNLHESCRTVILLHLEWNPAVVEQQIGRVDRKNSHWSRMMEKAIAEGAKDLPRIEIRPVIFRGTYDEHHWSVLSHRWDEQRSQLHGTIASDGDRELLNPDELTLLKEIEAGSPDFWPKP